MNFFTASETWPFGVSFAFILFIALVEGLGMLLAFSPSSQLDSLLPEFDAETGLDKVLGWLHLGKVPALVVMLLFLMGYSIFGYGLQWVSHSLLGFFVPAWLAGILAFPAGMGTVRGLGALVARIVPRDETSAVSEESLVGRVGVISLGHAARGKAAQAKVKDTHGRTHYLMLEPDVEDEVLEEGTQVLIVRKVGAFYRGIVNPHPTLM